MTPEEITSQVRAFIYENYLYARPDYELGPDDSLLSNGVIDSMGVIELVEFLQTSLGVDVQDEDITEAHFGSLRSITDYVASTLPVHAA